MECSKAHFLMCALITREIIALVSKDVQCNSGGMTLTYVERDYVCNVNDVEF